MMQMVEQDQGSGLDTFTLQRYSYVTRSWSTVKTWNLNGTTSSTKKTYTETSEGVFYYRVTIKDKAGNSKEASSSAIYLDHSNPVIYGLSNVVTDWTNVAPVISITTTDYLYGTSYNGSGVASVVIKDDLGVTVASGTTAASYTLQPKYEGYHTSHIKMCLCTLKIQ